MAYSKKKNSGIAMQEIENEKMELLRDRGVVFKVG